MPTLVLSSGRRRAARRILDMYPRAFAVGQRSPESQPDRGQTSRSALDRVPAYFFFPFLLFLLAIQITSLSGLVVVKDSLTSFTSTGIAPELVRPSTGRRGSPAGEVRR